MRDLEQPGAPQQSGARLEAVPAQQVVAAAGRFLVQLDRMSALLQRMELHEHRMTALHRRAVVREFLLSARDCHAALSRFGGPAGPENDASL